jgi:hypothetical protein
VVARIRLQRLGVVDAAIRLDLAEPEVPLADARGVIALLPQHAGDGQTARLDEVGRVSPKNTSGQRRPPAIAARQDAIARRRANGRRRVHVREADPLRGKFIRVGRRDCRLGVVAVEITPTEIVGQDVDNIGKAPVLPGRKARGRCCLQKQAPIHACQNPPRGR